VATFKYRGFYKSFLGFIWLFFNLPLKGDIEHLYITPDGYWAEQYYEGCEQEGYGADVNIPNHYQLTRKF
jgi:hypothetical protein